MVPPLEDAVIKVMAHKYAQRLRASDVADRLRRDVRLVLGELRMLERTGLVHSWSDGSWGLTSQGNLRRNQLTSRP